MTRLLFISSLALSSALPFAMREDAKPAHRFAVSVKTASPRGLARDLAGTVWILDSGLGTGDDHSDGRVITLHDRDGDNRVDRSGVFLTGLVAPQAILPLTPSIALVLEPPHLLLARDTDEDGTADAVQIVGGGLEGGRGLVLTADGTLYVNGTARRFFWNGSALRPRPSLDAAIGAAYERDDGEVFVLRGKTFSRLSGSTELPLGVINADIEVTSLQPTSRAVFATEAGSSSIWSIAVEDHAWRWPCVDMQWSGPIVVTSDDGEFLSLTDEQIIIVPPDGPSTGVQPEYAQDESLALLLASDDALLRAAARENLIAWCGDDNARLQLVEAPIRTIARHHEHPQARRAAMLAGWRLGILGADDAHRALHDESPDVRRAAITFTDAHGVRAALRDKHRTVQQAAIARAAQFLEAASDAVTIDAWISPLVAIAIERGETDDDTRRLLVAAVRGFEHTFAERLVHAGDVRGLSALVAALTDSALKRGSPQDARAFLELASRIKNDGRHVIAGRFAAGAGVNSRRQRPIHLDRQPDDFSAIASIWSPDVAAKLDPWIRWPARTDVPLPVFALSTEETIEAGRRLYASCLTCHGPAGRGQPGVYPPLRGSAWVQGDPGRFAKVLLHGLRGRVKVGDIEINGLMPKPAVETDEDIAAVMTYVRQAFGNQAPPVPAELVREVRAATKDRTAPWDVTELAGEHPPSEH